ncbi:hypothetical protein D3C77_452450 [compost metagenome]
MTLLYSDFFKLNLIKSKFILTQYMLGDYTELFILANHGLILTAVRFEIGNDDSRVDSFLVG